MHYRSGNLIMSTAIKLQIALICVTLALFFGLINHLHCIGQEVDLVNSYRFLLTHLGLLAYCVGAVWLGLGVGLSYNAASKFFTLFFVFLSLVYYVSVASRYGPDQAHMRSAGLFIGVVWFISATLTKIITDD